MEYLNTKWRKVIVLVTFLSIYLFNGYYPKMGLSAAIRVFFMLGICLFFLWKKRGTISISVNGVFLAMIVIVLQIITCIIYGFDMNSDIFLMLTICVGLLFTSLFSFKEFIDGYQICIIYIAGISLFFFGMGLFFPSYISYIPNFLLKKVPGTNYNTLLYTIILRSSVGTYYRNFSIFSEPGQFQIFLNISIIFELFFVEKTNWKRMMLLIISIISCDSTNGYIVLIFVLLSYMVDNRLDGNIREKRYKTLLFVIMWIAGIYFIWMFISGSDSIINSSLEKLKGFVSEYSYSGRESSGAERRRAFDTALQIFLEHPITGYGYIGMRRYVEILSKGSGFIMTFSPLNWFARHGLIYGIIANLSYLSCFLYQKKSFLSNVLLGGALIVMISAQAVTSDVIVWILIFYGFINIRKKKMITYN